MLRADCECVDWPKPCQYHEGWSDGFDKMKDYADAMENAWHDCSHAIDPLRDALAALVEALDANWQDGYNQIGAIHPALVAARDLL